MTQQVKVAKEIVDGIVAGADVTFQKFDTAPVYQARMITAFGFCLKSFGEAAVADANSFNPQIAGDIAQSRLMAAAHPEVWAHEGWKLMQAMNAAGDHVLPQLQAHINSLTTTFGRHLHNLPQIFWAIIGQNMSHTELRQLPDFTDNEDPEAIPMDMRDLVTVVLHAVDSHIEFYENLYPGISAHWKALLYAPRNGDWDPSYEIMIMAQPLLVSQIIDVAHASLHERLGEQAITRGWHVARSLVFSVLVELASYKFDASLLMPQNNFQSALRYGSESNVDPYHDQLSESVADKITDETMERFAVLTGAEHHTALCAEVYKHLVAAVVDTSTTLLDAVDDTDAEPRIHYWALDMRKC